MEATMTHTEGSREGRGEKHGFECGSYLCGTSPLSSKRPPTSRMRATCSCLPPAPPPSPLPLPPSLLPSFSSAPASEDKCLRIVRQGAMLLARTLDSCLPNREEG